MLGAMVCTRVPGMCYQGCAIRILTDFIFRPKKSGQAHITCTYTYGGADFEHTHHAWPALIRLLCSGENLIGIPSEEVADFASIFVPGTTDSIDISNALPLLAICVAPFY